MIKLSFGVPFQPPHHHHHWALNSVWNIYWNIFEYILPKTGYLNMNIEIYTNNYIQIFKKLLYDIWIFNCSNIYTNQELCTLWIFIWNCFGQIIVLSEWNYIFELFIKEIFWYSLVCIEYSNFSIFVFDHIWIYLYSNSISSWHIEYICIRIHCKIQYLSHTGSEVKLKVEIQISLFEVW